jgi:large subunit ribosomal protein L21
VAPGDRILVDRITAEPGSSVKIGRVLMLRDGSDIKVGLPAVEGMDVEAKVIAHSRGPRVETLRYKSKKRVRVHRGGRADLTALEIIAIGGMKVATGEETEKETDEDDAAPKTKKDTKRKPKAVAEAAATTESKAEAKAEAKSEAKAEAPKRAARETKKKDAK